MIINDKDGIKIEKDYSDFLDSNEADVMFENFSTALREAFFAGYKAAGGDVSVFNNNMTISVNTNKILHSKLDNEEKTV